MRIGLFHCKDNRKIYRTMFESLRLGFQTYGMKVESYDGENAAKAVGNNEKFDLSIVFTNAVTRTGSIRDFQLRNQGKYLTLYLSPIQSTELLTFQNREAYINSTDPNLLIYCDLFEPNGWKHFYLDGNGPSRRQWLFDYLEQLLKPRKSNGYILIPEQVFPEGFTTDGDLIEQKINWPDWLNEQLSVLRKYHDEEIVISRHPNRKARPLNLKHKNIRVSNEGTSILLSSAKYLYTLSSKVVIESVLSGIPSVTHDLNSIVYECCNPELTLTDAWLFLLHRNWWANNIAYSIYKKSELESGTYVDYLLNVLLPEYDKRLVRL